MRLRSTILASLAFALSLTGCGRSDMLEGDPAGIYEVQDERELRLDDGEMVYVEITAPADPDVTAAVMALHDGCSFDDLVDTLAPEGEIDFKYFGDVAVHVKVDSELRAVIWQ